MINLYISSMKDIFFLFIFITSACFSDIKSTNGVIKFDSQMDNQAEMILNGTGLGVGITPTANLHINGNSIISDQLFVGGSSGSSNLNISGTLGFSVQSVSSDTSLGDHSVVLADTSSTNITLDLPPANNVPGRTYYIKKTSLLNQLWVSASDNIDAQDGHLELTYPSSGYSYTKLLSDGSKWYILNESNDTLNVIGADNLVGWWKLNESDGSVANDSSLFNHHGALDASLDFSTNVTNGILNNALVFDGSDDSITVDHSSEINFGHRDTPYSISFFIKTSSTTTSGIVTKSRNGNIDMPYLVFLDSSGNVQFWSWDQPGGAQFNFQSSTQVNDDAWHHVVCVYESSSSRYIYVDGQLSKFDNTVVSNDLSNTNNSLLFGQYHNHSYSDTYLDGSLDDIRIYNKALSSSEIEELHSQTE